MVFMSVDGHSGRTNADISDFDEATNKKVKTLSARATVAGVWAIAGKLGAKVIDLGTLIMLAHFLMPADMGLIAMAMTAVLIIDTILDLPIAAALLRSENPTDELFDTAFTLGVIRGIAIGLILAILAWPLSVFYGYPELTAIIGVLSLAPAMRGMANPRMIVFAQRLDLRRDFVIDVGSKSCAFLAAIPGAAMFHSHWAVVAATITAPLFGLVLSFAFVPVAPRLTLVKWRHFSSIFGWNTLTQFISALNWQLERLMLPRFIPIAPFGRFTVATDVSAIPHQAFVQPLVKPLVATFTRFEDPKELGKVYCQVVGGYVLFLGLIFMIMGTLAEPLVTIVFGETWAPAAPILTWLAIINIISIPLLPLAPLALRLNQMHFLTIRMAGEMVVRIPITLVCIALYGVNGALMAQTAAAVAVLAIVLWSVREMTGASIVEQLGGFLRPLIGLAVTFCLYRYTSPLQFEGQDLMGQLWRAAAAGVILTASYGALVAAMWHLSGRPEGAETYALNRMRIV